ncbi:14410_t:CDS:2 [Funneliformis mosseae]|uniref:14410_t:CDS:1 n=1 Tax=Funneliformis mosseae TaxID=27381 RepID=A0A9N9N5Z2_FUNMO|nr:14410_t:CDS:2 [Funneliformis mosseae]
MEIIDVCDEAEMIDACGEMKMMDTFSDSSSYSELLSRPITNNDELILFESNSDYFEESQNSEYDSQIDDNKGYL